MTDIHTGWTEIRACWNKPAEVIVQKVKNIEESLPFKILGFDSDNGSEFINSNLMDYLTKRKPDDKVEFTRSRPYRKNDSVRIEQKNFTHVRKLLGYERFEDPKLVPMLNDLFKKELSLFNNHFIPAMKLASKERVGSSIKKIYHQPITLYAKLLESDVLNNLQKQRLITLHQNINPLEFRKAIDTKLDAILKIVRKQNITNQ